MIYYHNNFHHYKCIKTYMIKLLLEKLPYIMRKIKNIN